MTSSPNDPDPSRSAARRVRLDADGMIVREGADADASGPAAARLSPLPPVLLTGLGVLATALTLAQLVGSAPPAGEVRAMVPLVLASALALGGYSLARLVQLLVLVGERARRAGRGEDLPPVPWGLTQEHALHGMWLVGVGASIALMGVLGLWSLLEGEASGLEPGWPLLLVGGAVSLLADRLRRRIEGLWQDAGEDL
jgi:hypothetical protein